MRKLYVLWEHTWDGFDESVCVETVNNVATDVFDLNICKTRSSSCYEMRVYTDVELFQTPGMYTHYYGVTEQKTNHVVYNNMGTVLYEALCTVYTGQDIIDELNKIEV